jgi:hypothetical protein
MFSNETYNKVQIGKNMSNAFPIQNGLKLGDNYHHCFSILLQNCHCHQEGPKRRSGRTGTEWNTSAHYLY